ncbi:MAG TPA: MaoC/PaaZ C-terminal domain-containing protein [Acidimicrobiales bacterium]|jgi:acyl dehydratase|nr:MaoC/PaaZ C-terminal domain-containing protein [Acidimicrobiales bacterium]
MAIDPGAVGAKGDPVESSWTSRDSLLYAVGVGAGQEPLEELAFTTENSMNITQRVLPTQAVVLGFGGGGVMGKIGSFNPAMLVHGEERIELHQEIPVAGKVSTVGEITAIWDKGKGAVVESTSVSTLLEGDGKVGEPLFTTVMSAFIRGEGDFGGERGPSGPRNVPPERDPDHKVTYTTRPEQALIYRLSGDRNPLHADPQFAKMGGFDRPILHGLCTYGFTGRALLNTVCEGDPSRFKAMEGRFSSPVFPGESLTISVWGTGGSEAVFQTQGGDGRIVLDAGLVKFA